MKKRPFVAIINTLEANGANIVDDTVAKYWSVMKSSADANALLNFDYGKVVSFNYVSSTPEVRQEVRIGGTAVKEVITASTKYSIMIGNPGQDYETQSQHPIIHSYTTPAVISATPAVALKAVYDALVAKINAYAGNNVSASAAATADYTLGTQGAGQEDNFTIGETVTQADTLVTAKVGASTIASGTFALDTAAGTIVLYDISDESAIALTAKVWTGTTSLASATITNATTVLGAGLTIIDDAGYYTNKIGRGGISWIALRSGFTSDTPVITVPGVYAQGVGAVMVAQRPEYDYTKLDLTSGSMEYDFQDGDVADAAKFYRKYIIEYEDGDEDAIGATLERARTENILYVDESSGANLTAFHNALAAAAVK